MGNRWGSMLPSVLRTFVPIAVGYFTALPVARFLGLSDQEVTGLFTALITGVYWAAVRALERYVVPEAGWLLGWGSPPVYAPPAEVAEDARAGIRVQP